MQQPARVATIGEVGMTPEAEIARKALYPEERLCGECANHHSNVKQRKPRAGVCLSCATRSTARVSSCPVFTYQHAEEAKT